MFFLVFLGFFIGFFTRVGFPNSIFQIALRPPPKPTLVDDFLFWTLLQFAQGLEFLVFFTKEIEEKPKKQTMTYHKQ